MRKSIERGIKYLREQQRPKEGLLDSDLLVECEAHKQRHRDGRDQLIGLVGLGEVQTVRHAAIVSCST